MDVDHGCWHTTDYHYDLRLVVAGQTGSGHQACPESVVSTCHLQGCQQSTVRDVLNGLTEILIL